MLFHEFNHSEFFRASFASRNIFRTIACKQLYKIYQLDNETDSSQIRQLHCNPHENVTYGFKFWSLFLEPR